MLSIAKVYERQKQLLEKMPYAERRIASLLDEIGTHYRPQELFIFPTRIYYVDFYIADMRKMVLECDGPNHNQRKDYDARRTQDLLTSDRVKTVIRLSNDDCHTISKAELREVLKQKESATYSFA